MSTISFTVLGDPKALKRHRNRLSKQRRFLGTYDPSKNDKADFLAKAMAHAPESPITESLSMVLTFVLPRPKNHYGTGRNANLLKPSAPFWCTKQPDLDNLIKFVKDALDGIFYRDDSLIVKLRAEKRYAIDACPQTHILLRELNKFI